MENALRVVKHEKLKDAATITCECCGRSVVNMNILETGEKVGDECAGLIEHPVYRYGRKLTKKQQSFFDSHGLKMPERKTRFI